MSSFPAMKRPNVGDIVAINAVDWGYEEGQHAASSAFDIVRARIYGQVVIVNDEWITIAPQVFDGGDVRCALSIPWVTVSLLIVLERAHSLDMPGATSAILEASKP